MNKQVITKIASNCWNLANLAMFASRRVMLWGPAGTGKTFGAQRIGLRNEQPVITVTLTDDTSAADLLGYYINTPDGYRWQDGPATFAWRTGARLVLNEIDHASGDATAALYSILDDPASASIRLASGEVLRPHPDFTCVATSNVKPEEALRGEGMASRFALSVHITEPHPDSLARFPEPARKAILGLINHPDPKLRLTPRSFDAFYHMIANLPPGFTQLDAANVVFGANRGEAILDSLCVSAT